MTYSKACCSACARGMGDLASNPADVLSPTQKTAAYVLAFGAALGAVILLTESPLPRRRRPAHVYDDPGLRETRRLPRESMRQVVEERRR